MTSERVMMTVLSVLKSRMSTTGFSDVIVAGIVADTDRTPAIGIAAGLAIAVAAVRLEDHEYADESGIDADQGDEREQPRSPSPAIRSTIRARGE